MLLPRVRCLSLLGLSSSTEQVKQIHAQMVTNSLLRDPSNLGKLIKSYLESHEGDDDDDDGDGYARLAFRRHNDNTPRWCSPPLKDSLMLFFTQQARGAIEINKLTYTYALQVCARLKALREGKQIHAQIIKTVVLDADVAVQTTGVHFYAACRDIYSARRVFDAMPERSCVTWNAMLTAYSANGSHSEQALVLFRQMLRAGMRPTDRTVVPVLSACSRLGDLRLGSLAHGFICKAIPSHQDCVFIGTGLVDMYSKCGCLMSALSVFEKMSRRNVLSWSAITSGLAVHGQGRAALSVLDEMCEVGVSPNAVTFTSLFAACCHAGLVEEGLQLFDAMESRFSITPVMQHYGCMVDLLGRAGMVEEAYGIVRRMPFKPDDLIWRALLGACKIHGHVELAEEAGRTLLQLDRAPDASMNGTRLPATCEDFVALSNVYASAERWGDVSTLRAMMNGMGIQNKAGCSSL